jgi:UDP-N-acetylmuramyl pentapeptide phosphotransferase/UDP-N-acetylglucosamine-1-phosphate transferase
VPANTLTPALFLLAAAASAILTLIWIGIARKRALLDQPGARRVHSQPTPRGGGIGIALLAAGAWFWLASRTDGMPGAAQAGWGIALLAATGLIDDLRDLGAPAKLLGQLVAAAVLCSGGLAPTGALLAVAVVACAYWVNIVNFMDGGNGLVGLQGLLLALVLAIWPGQSEQIVFSAVVLAGACAGFLPFNLGHARTFLGDVGSHAIGAALFGLFLTSWKSGSLPLACALTLATPLLLDSGLTLFSRIRAGRPAWRAHREHLYQYAIRSQVPHLWVALAYGGWTLASSLLSTVGLTLRSSLVMWTLFTLNVIVGTTAYCGLKRHWRVARKQGRSVHE